MTSIGPYSKSYDQTHMYDFTDSRRYPRRDIKYCPQTLMGIINTTKELSIASYIVKLANYDGILNDKQANFTMFLPSDTFLKKYPESVFVNFDKGTALNLMKGSMTNRRMTAAIIEDSPAAFFTTLDTSNKIFISNISDTTYINNKIKVVQKDIFASNGVIHIIDDLLWPVII